MQKDEGQPQQVVMVMPLLEGLDGVKKNVEILRETTSAFPKPAQEMYGKLMSRPLTNSCPATTLFSSEKP